MPFLHQDNAQLESRGITFMETVHDYIRNDTSFDVNLAMDAQPGLITTSNSGIPSFLANYLEPKLVEVLLTPMKAEDIIGSAKKGDWTTLTAMFPIIESTGDVSSYGDYDNGGQSSANFNFPQRQSYHFQTNTRWGERELDTAGLAKIDWASRLNIASAVTLNKYMNKTWFYGVAGLQCYGLTNDPNLVAPITPATKTEGGVVWGPASADEVYEDIRLLFVQLQSQANGLIEQDQPLVLAMSPTSEVNLAKTNVYGLNVYDKLKKNFPNIRFERAVEYANQGGGGSGQLVQMIAEEVEGQETGFAAFTEKMRAHAIVRDTSSFRQKKSAGTWGAVIQQPFAIAAMLGV